MTDNTMPPPPCPGVMLITGAAKRVGRGIAEYFAARTWRLGIHYNGSRTAADELVHAIETRGGQAIALQADLNDPAATTRLIPALSDAFGPPDCLINNASLFEPDKATGFTLESWASHMDVNLRAPVLLSQAFARQLPEHKPGNIINLLDQKVWKLTPYYFTYTLSKAGLWTATQTMAQALAPRIRVNAIGPGPTLPNARQTEADFADQCRKTPLQTGTSPLEIARAIEFILQMPAMTGQMIALDGGRHLAWNTPDVTNKHD